MKKERKKDKKGKRSIIKYNLLTILIVGFTGSDKTLNKGGIPVFLLLYLKKEETRG
jgi:hypothetical protein